MQIKNFIIYSLLVFLILGLNSCSSDTNEVQEMEITVSTTDFTTTINENPTNGEVIGMVSGTTNEGSVTFSIEEQTPLGAFAIDSNSGELTVADETVFDFQTNPTITGIVKVANGSVFENANITIDLNNVNEENIFIGDVQLHNQDEVDAFGLNNYTQVTGVLYIGGGSMSETIVNIESLSTIWLVGLDLKIWNTSLETLNALANITKIGRHLNINHNSVLTDIEGMSGINIIHGELALTSNEVLPSIEGLKNITRIEAGLYLQVNPNIQNLNALSNLTYVGGSIQINSLSSITNLDGLINTTNASEGLTLQSNDSLIDITGLSNISSSLNLLEIIDNDLLPDLNGIDHLVNIDGITISRNASLTDLDMLSNVVNTNGIQIESNSSLENINGLSNIISTNSSLNIYNNALLENIDALIHFTIISGTLNISQNQTLINLNGLQNISSVSGDLVIYNNSSLDDLCGLNNLIINGGLTGQYTVLSNPYNPSQQDIINGDCRL
jgi:hypothetical protein